MDKAHQLSSSTLRANLPGRLTMLGSLSLHWLASCTLLLLVLSSGESRPRKDAPDVGGQRLLLMEAVKMGILGSLGMDREPRPAQKASEEELRKMYQLYREKLREMRGNTSRTIEETWQSNMSTVLFPATGEVMLVRNTLRPQLAHSSFLND